MTETKKAEILNEIERITGMKLTVCTDFKERRNSFNITLKESIGVFNREMNDLKRYAEKYKTITIQENGYQRALITALK